MIQNSKLISVIIPIYNTEQYISDCLKSIVSQTYQNLEIILVDDNGCDNSIKIANNFLKNDKRIKILSYQQNKGVSFARNYGLKNANGEYIYFMDSDDFISLNYIEEMFKNIKDFDIIQNNNWVEYISPKKLNIIKHNKSISANIWNKLYKKNFLIENNIIFPLNIKMGEDLCFNYNCISLTKKIQYCDLEVTYFYRQSQNSTVKKLKKENNILEAFDILFNILKINNALNMISLPLYHLRRHLQVAKNKNKEFLKIKNFFTKINMYINLNKDNYKKKDILFFNCILKNNNYILYRVMFTIKKFIK